MDQKDLDWNKIFEDLFDENDLFKTEIAIAFYKLQIFNKNLGQK